MAVAVVERWSLAEVRLYVISKAFINILVSTE